MEHGATKPAQNKQRVPLDHGVEGLTPIWNTPVYEIADQESQAQADNQLQAFFDEPFQGSLLAWVLQFPSRISYGWQGQYRLVTASQSTTQYGFSQVFYAVVQMRAIQNVDHFECGRRIPAGSCFGRRYYSHR